MHSNVEHLTTSVEDAPFTPFVLPDFCAQDIFDVDFELLASLGRGHVLLDFDLTLKAKGEPTIRPEVVERLNSLNTSGLIGSLSLATNSINNVSRIAAPLEARIFRPFISNGRLIKKPNTQFFLRILDKLDVEPSETVMIGDQCGRDLIGANRVGITTVKVEPLGQDYFFDRLKILPGRRSRRQRDDQRLRAAQAMVRLGNSFTYMDLPLEN